MRLDTQMSDSPALSRDTRLDSDLKEEKNYVCF